MTTRVDHGSRLLCIALACALAFEVLPEARGARLSWPLFLGRRSKPAAAKTVQEDPFQLVSAKHSTVIAPELLGRNEEADAERGGRTADPLTLGLDHPRVSTVFSQNSRAHLGRIADDDNVLEELDMDLAYLAGRLTSAAYCRVPQIQSWNCSRCLAVGVDVAMHAVIFDPDWDLTSFVSYLPQTNTIAVAFKGTDSSSIANWMRNLQSWRLDHTYPMPQSPHALIHIGFYNMWHFSLQEADVTAAVGQLLAAHPTANLLVTGHSMGGALAQLCALDMKFGFNLTSVRVITFGSPRVGNQAYTELFAEAMTESWRFTRNRDIVPSLPPLIVGFRHVAREVWLVDVDTETGVEEKMLVCDRSGEDPSCHDSACYLGICTSIADHLTYLGLHMYHNVDEC